METLPLKNITCRKIGNGIGFILPKSLGDVGLVEKGYKYNLVLEKVIDSSSLNKSDETRFFTRELGVCGI